MKCVHQKSFITIVYFYYLKGRRPSILHSLLKKIGIGKHILFFCFLGHNAAVSGLLFFVLVLSSYSSSQFLFQFLSLCLHLCLCRLGLRLEAVVAHIVAETKLIASEISHIVAVTVHAEDASSHIVDGIACIHPFEYAVTAPEKR